MPKFIQTIEITGSDADYIARKVTEQMNHWYRSGYLFEYTLHTMAVHDIAERIEGKTDSDPGDCHAS